MAASADQTLLHNLLGLEHALLGPELPLDGADTAAKRQTDFKLVPTVMGQLHAKNPSQPRAAITAQHACPASNGARCPGHGTAATPHCSAASNNNRCVALQTALLVGRSLLELLLGAQLVGVAALLLPAPRNDECEDV
jgi:hypothetical protein